MGHKSQINSKSRDVAEKSVPVPSVQKKSVPVPVPSPGLASRDSSPMGSRSHRPSLHRTVYIVLWLTIKVHEEAGQCDHKYVFRRAVNSLRSALYPRCPRKTYSNLSSYDCGSLYRDSVYINDTPQNAVQGDRCYHLRRHLTGYFSKPSRRPYILLDNSI